MVWKLINKNSMQYKLIVAFFAVVFISLIFVSSVILKFSKRVVENKVDQSLKYVSDYISNEVNFYIKELDNISYEMYLNSDITDILKNNKADQNDYNIYLNANKINKELSNIVLNKPYITRLIILSRDDVIYSSGRGEVYEAKKLKDEKWYSLVTSSESKESISIEYQNIGGNKDIPTISFTKSIVDISNGQALGYINLQINYGVINDIFYKNKLVQNHQFCILDEHNKLLYPKEVEDLIPRLLDENLHPLKDSKDYYITKASSGVEGLKFISIVPKKEIMKDYNNIKMLLYGYITVFVFILLLIIFLLSEYFTRPLKKLSASMERVQKGDFNVTITKSSSDEIGVISDVFNSMMDTIKDYIKQVQKKEMERVDAELSALQAQINPHFIYHTLNTVLWIAKINKINSIQKIIVSLIDILKTSIGNTNKMITVEEEINYVAHYVEIENFRFKDEIRLEYDIADSIKGMKTLKMVLQPLVENSINHGFEDRNGNEWIKIAAYSDGANLFFEVIDNGKGMDEDTIRNIEHGRQMKSKSTGIGINNINNRIKLNFGEKYGVSLRSALNQGTTVTIMQPIVK